MRVMLDDGAYEPTRAYPTDAGLDLYAKEDADIPPYGSAVFHTGVHVEIPEGCAGLLVSKSGLNVNMDLTSTGLIDQGYTGEILVKLHNHSAIAKGILRGHKISQLVIIPVRYEPVEIVDKLDVRGRGNNGIGSTGP